MDQKNDDQFFDALVNADMNDIDIESFNAHSDMIGLDKIHEAKPYDESEIFAISDEYYKTKGIMAWSNRAAKIVPHKVGTNYQAALAFAHLVKANIKNYSSKERINILECGAGSGRFSRQLLHAFQALGLQGKCRLLITDYSKRNLEEIRDSSMLDEFEEGDDYKLIEFDIVNSSRGTNLDDKRFNLNNVGAVFLHYVLDALPLTVLRNKADQQEELYLTTYRRKDQAYDLLENDFFQARLQLNESWQPYDWSIQTEPERYYHEHLQEFYKHSKEEFYYCYSALRAIDNINRLLDDRAFILSSDILACRDKRYVVVGNSVAHAIDSEFILALQKQQGNFGCIINEPDKNLSRLLITKSPNVLDDVRPVFEEHYLLENNITKYLEIEKALDHLIKGNDPESLLVLLRQFTKLAPHCATTYKFWSEYYKMIKKDNYAMEALAKATCLDFWGDI
ncbi:MAG: SAM-dependent methyltransferase [Cyanobacteria bacterium]|nr:SAM-dependent methyltransferase [Cyanobacteriota bacterium]MDA1021410.1 SAM-dependent methyltransferase [Cyanobacteriota bacterium]